MFLRMTRLIKIITLSALAAFIGVTAAHAGHEKLAKTGSAPDISIEDLKAAIEEGSVVVIDVNGSKSYKNGHIPTAIDFAEVAKGGLADLLPEDKSTMVVAYCGGPSCGAYKKAVKAVAALGYTDVHHLSAGIRGWKSAGEAVEKA